MRHRYIAIEGPIGVGKSSFAEHLAERIGADRVRDTERMNPWLEPFYLDPRANALHAQMQFLITRIAVLERIDRRSRPSRSVDGGGRGTPSGPAGRAERGAERAAERAAATARRQARPIVSDFIIEKDPLFAELTLDENEWRLYHALFERLVGELACPDLVVYLQAPVERLIERIERRGIGFERHIDSTYLHRLSASYERFFHDFQASPLLIVNTDAIDLANDEAAIDRLITRIDALEGGRHYFNPA